MPAESFLEETDCSVCGAPTPRTRLFWVEGFALVRCPGCGVKRISPRLRIPELRDYYGEAYWKSEDSVCRGYFDYRGDRANIVRTFRRRLRLLARLGGKSGRLLDVGCASGFLLAEAVQQGWEAWGVEWSQAAVAAADPGVRPRIYPGQFRDPRSLPGELDLVTCWDYLEHSPDPRADLELAARLLKPGALLSIIVPDAGSWLARLLGPRWEEYKKPREHLYFFTGAQLERLLARLGFGIVHRGWAGKYASLDFALSRFKPGDGWAHALAAGVKTGMQSLGLSQKVCYINPFDKRHLVARKQS